MVHGLRTGDPLSPLQIIGNFFRNLWIAPHCKQCPNSRIEIANIACNRSKQTLDTPASGAEGSELGSKDRCPGGSSIWQGAEVLGSVFFVGRTCFGIINHAVSGVRPFVSFKTHFHTFRRPVI